MNNNPTDEFVRRQLPENRKIIVHLKEILMNAAPGMKEEWKFGSNPFYVLNRWVAFIAVKDGKVQLGFCEGAHLDDGLNKLERKELKQVRYITLSQWDGESEDTVRYYLLQAIDFDLNRALKKKKG